jgi:copper chaperone CopZ
MKRQYEVLNIKCGGCATTVTDTLKDRFPDIEVNLDKEPRIVSATINNDDDETYLIETLHKLGYPLKTAELSKLTEKYLYGKSYVSCMHGKVAAKNKK